jgi:ApbE superfamily uncharacterized protein (UPF0280 family)
VWAASSIREASAASYVSNPATTTCTPMEAKSGTLATYKLRAMDAVAAADIIREDGGRVTGAGAIAE